MSKLVLYGYEGSPPVRGTLLALRALELPFEFKIVNMLAGEHLTKEYLAMNPQHTIPTLDDDGQYLWDSHAISAYLANKYGKDDKLYPTDPYQRAVIDQRLHYDSGTVFNALKNITAPLFFKNVTDVPQEKIDNITAVYDLLEIFLQDHDYMAGDDLTIADLSLVSTVTSLNAIWEIDEQTYEKLSAWIKRIEALPYYAESNGRGLQLFKGFLSAKGLNVPPK